MMYTRQHVSVQELLFPFNIPRIQAMYIRYYLEFIFLAEFL